MISAHFLLNYSPLIFRVSTCVLQPQKVYATPQSKSEASALPLHGTCHVPLSHISVIAFSLIVWGFLLLWKSFPHYISGFMREGIKCVWLKPLPLGLSIVPGT